MRIHFLKYGDASLFTFWNNLKEYVFIFENQYWRGRFFIKILNNITEDVFSNTYVLHNIKEDVFLSTYSNFKICIKEHDFLNIVSKRMTIVKPHKRTIGFNTIFKITMKYLENKVGEKKLNQVVRRIEGCTTSRYCRLQYYVIALN